MKLEPFINASPDIIVLKDKDGRWIEANSKTLELFNIEEYQGKTEEELGELYPHFAVYVPVFVKSDLQAWETGKQVEVKESVIFNNSERIYEVIKVPIFDSARNRQNLIVFGRDITDLEKSEQTYKSQLVEKPPILKSMILKKGVFDVLIDFDHDIWFARYYQTTICCIVKL